MIDRIMEIIQNEDKKNPLTDEEIASMIGVKREDITQLRLINNIPDSRERRKPYILNDVEKIITEHGDISDRLLTKKLNDLGYNISRFVASQIKKELYSKLKKNLNVAENVDKDTAEFYKDDIETKEKDLLSFREIIGHDGSLKVQISQAKAAVLYPPHGLHTLILGPSGVGKSQIAEAMYNFAIESGRYKKGAPFIVFNCADYADNPQLLLSQLFGYNKGAFTGADTTKPGLVEKADGGILFLDEVHRLPSEGQEILFYLLDKGKFRRLGETENIREVNIMLIAATTENPESSLLLTFRRRIPMVIELPPLKDRPYSERFEIITHFFSKEAFRINRTIIVKKDVIRALMLYDCPGNIGQLRSDIQVACARGFLNSMGNRQSTMFINISDVPNYVRMGLLKVNKREPDMEKYLNDDLIVSPNKINKLYPKEDRYILPDEIYQFIEERFSELEKQGLKKEEINEIVARQVETELKRFAKNINSNILIYKKDIKEIVGGKIADAAEKAFKIAKNTFNNIQDNLYYSLAIHLSATYERIKSGKVIINPQLENVKKEYPIEYTTAKIMAMQISNDLGIELPEDEVGFIAMYLKTFYSEKEIETGRVGVIVLTHGHVASGMAEVANRLLGVNHAVGIEMSLDESPESALERTIETVRKMDEGKGCIILVDMGSLVTFGEIITKRTGIPTRVVGRVDTVMVLEALRRAIIPDTNLNEIADALDVDKVYVGRIEGANDLKLPKAIVTLCITGEGTALKVKKYIEDLIPNIKEEFRIIPIGMIRQDDIDYEISKIMKKYNVVAFVGTINPNVEGVPFISVEEILKGSGAEKLRKITGVTLKKESPLKDVIYEDLILCNVDISMKSDIIDMLVELLESKGHVDDRFLLSVYKRESMGATLMKGGIAIPHGAPEHVTKPAIAIAKLPNPIFWEGEFETDLVFMIALKEDSKDYFMSLYEAISDEQILKAIKQANNPGEIRGLILKNTIPAK